MRARKTSRTTKRAAAKANAVKRVRGHKRVASSKSTHRSQRLPLREIPASLDNARQQFMVTKSVKIAARNNGISESRLRRLIRNYKLAKWNRKTRKWRITDRARREVGIVSNGSAKAIVVRGFSKAQLAMAHHAAVKRFLETNDVAVLAPFEGQSITDVGKRSYLLETRPNVLLRLANTGGDADMMIYRLID
jgi:hypothetical protein